MKKIVKSRAFRDRLKGHKDGVISLHSPDGIQGGMLYSASKDRCIRGWDLVSRKITIKLLVSRDLNKTIQEGDNQNYDLGENEEKEEIIKKINLIQDNYEKKYQDNIGQQRVFESEIINQDQFTACCFSENSIYGGFDDGNIFAWNLSSGELVHQYSGHIDRVTQMQFIYPGVMISCSLDFTVRLWDVVTGFNQSIFQLTFKVQEDEKLSLPNVLPFQVVDNFQGWINYMLNYEDHYLFTAGDDNKICVWDLTKNMKKVEIFEGHEDSVVSLCFAGNMLYSGSYDHSIRSWDLSEMMNRIRERNYMLKEDLWSKKFNAWYQKLYAKKKKKKGAAKKGKKGKKGK